MIKKGVLTFSNKDNTERFYINFKNNLIHGRHGNGFLRATTKELSQYGHSSSRSFEFYNKTYGEYLLYPDPCKNSEDRLGIKLFLSFFPNYPIDVLKNLNYENMEIKHFSEENENYTAEGFHKILKNEKSKHGKWRIISKYPNNVIFKSLYKNGLAHGKFSTGTIEKERELLDITRTFGLSGKSQGEAIRYHNHFIMGNNITVKL